jgi:cytochrome-b5 reductase
MDELKTGQAVEMSGPKGRFEYKPNAYQSVGMIAGGSGLTPMLQVVCRW